MLTQAIDFTRGVALALARGHLFPVASREVMARAPGGSRPRAASPQLNQHAQFLVELHSVPTRGLSEPLTILHLTDVHLRRRGPWLDALTRQLRGLSADLVVITGDVVTKGWDLDAARQFLGALPPARLGRFAVMGNWEYWAGADPGPWATLLAQWDVALLNNRWTDLGPLALAGTDDLLAGTPDVEAAFRGLGTDKPVVALTHSPAMFEQLDHPALRLVLSGHSHGGQIRLPLIGSPFVPRGTGAYVGGWYHREGVDLFVSRGIGWSMAPVRFRCPPEIAELGLTPAGD